VNGLDLKDNFTVALLDISVTFPTVGN